MALSVGDTACTTGLSGAIYTQMQAQAVNMGGLGSDANVKALCYALANAIIPFLTANAVITCTVGASQGGLQISAAVGVATAAPGAPQNITGVLS